MSGSANPAPNYQGAAEHQSQQTWAMNHPNTSNPFSSTTWTQTAGAPMGGGMAPSGGGGGFGISGGPLSQQQAQDKYGILGIGAAGLQPNEAAQSSAGYGAPSQYSMSTQLSPGLQAAMDSMVAQLRGGPVGGGAFDAAYNQATSRLDPMWAQRQNDLTAQLAAQGLDPSSQAYQAQYANFGRDRNDAYNSAENQAFGQGLEAFKTNMQGLGGLYSFLQGPTYATGQGPDYLGAAGMLGNYNLGQANQINQTAGQGAQAAGSAIGAGIGLASLMAAARGQQP